MINPVVVVEQSLLQHYKHKLQYCLNCNDTMGRFVQDLGFSFYPVMEMLFCCLFVGVGFPLIITFPRSYTFSEPETLDATFDMEINILPTNMCSRQAFQK